MINKKKFMHLITSRLYHAEKNINKTATLMFNLKKFIPERHYPFILQNSFKFRRALAWMYLGNKFVCPCCNGHFKKFLWYGVKPRLNAQCPRCGSLERHRLLWLYLKEKTNFFKKNLKVLDIAPSEFFQDKCKSLQNINYISIDISSPIAKRKMDITKMSFQSNEFDCIICYHVLEHVLDDKKAMNEILRVLKPGGWTILQSPIDRNREKTFEDPRILLPNERARVFGQSDHVRIYGKDYKYRLEEAGFIVKIDNFIKKFEINDIKIYGLTKDEKIYFCTKPKKKNKSPFEI